MRFFRSVGCRDLLNGDSWTCGTQPAGVPSFVGLGGAKVQQRLLVPFGLAFWETEILRGEVIREAVFAAVVAAALRAADAESALRGSVNPPLAEGETTWFGSVRIRCGGRHRFATVDGGVEAVTTADLQEMRLGPFLAGVFARNHAFHFDDRRICRITVAVYGLRIANRRGAEVA